MSSRLKIPIAIHIGSFSRASSACQWLKSGKKKRRVASNNRNEIEIWKEMNEAANNLCWVKANSRHWGGTGIQLADGFVWANVKQPSNNDLECQEKLAQYPASMVKSVKKIHLNEIFGSRHVITARNETNQPKEKVPSICLRTLQIKWLKCSILWSVFFSQPDGK